MNRPASMSFGFPQVTRGVKFLLIAIAVVSVGTGATRAFFSPEWGALAAHNLAFSGAGVLHGKIWQLVTYTLLTLDPIYLLLALWMVWMFGSPLERRWGTARFLTFYFLTSAAAAGATTLIGLVSPGVLATPYAGIWTGLEALSAAFALSFPDNRINMFFVFPLQARYLIHVSAGITLLFILMTGSVLPYVCPILGLAAGVLFSRGALSGPRHLWLRLRVFFIERKLANRKLRVVPGSRDETRRKSGSDEYLH